MCFYGTDETRRVKKNGQQAFFFGGGRCVSQASGTHQIETQTLRHLGRAHAVGGEGDAWPLVLEYGNIVLYRIVLYSVLLCYTCCIVLYCIGLDWIVLLYCVVLYCKALYCTILSLLQPEGNVIPVQRTGEKIPPRAGTARLPYSSCKNLENKNKGPETKKELKSIINTIKGD